MNWFTGILVYTMVWVVVLLTVLPWGVRPAEHPEPGHEPGAPERPLLLRKMIATSLIAAAIWGGIYVVIDQGWISFRESVQLGTSRPK
jgi:predicted secreted protein